MTPDQIKLVQTSFGKVVPIKEQAGKLFYGRLFELDPSLRALFPEDLTEQIGKLMATLAVAVNGLNKLEEILPAVQELGRRHVAYQVKDSDYDTVGTALIWTLEQGLGDDFTPEVKEAWIDCYTILADVIKQAASEMAA